MKLLLAAACISVIALTGYVIGGDYYSAKKLNRQAFHAECNEIASLRGDLSSVEASRVARVKKIAEDCAEYVRTGYYPHERWGS
jgi:hypothetical protein